MELEILSDQASSLSKTKVRYAYSLHPLLKLSLFGFFNVLLFLPELRDYHIYLFGLVLILSKLVHLTWIELR
jgi:hypothetical protein